MEKQKQKEISSITIESTDEKFLLDLISWLEKYKVKPNSTVITLSTPKNEL